MIQPRSAKFYVEVFGTVTEALGLLLTAWRICFRLGIGRFWWEDAWAAVLLPTGVLWIISTWIYQGLHGPVSVIDGWISSLGLTCLVMMSRMSILFSIIRIVYGGPRLLKFTYVCAAYFAMSWTIVIIEKIVQCASASKRDEQLVESAICLHKTPLSAFELTTDCVAVSILVVLPLRMLWRVNLPKNQRRMILCIFASSVVLAFATVCHSVGEIMNVSIVSTSGMHTQASSSIIVCNLLVVVTYIYHVLRRKTAGSNGTTRGHDLENDDDDFTTPRIPPSSAEVRTQSSRALHLTTVDLEALPDSPEMSSSKESI